MKRSCWTIVLIGTCLSFGHAESVAAQDIAKADALYQEGITKLQAGLYQEACDLLQKSLDLDLAAGTKFALADCRAFVGEIAAAMRHYNEYLTMVEGMPPEKQERQKQTGRVERAKAQITALRPDVPQVTFEVSGELSAGTRVEHDGKELKVKSLKAPMDVDPGEHLVVVLVPGKEARETRYSVAKGERKTVRLGGLDPKPEKKIEQPSKVFVDSKGSSKSSGESKTSGMRMGAYIAGGVGVLGLGVGAVFGGMVLNESKNLLVRCPKEEGTGKLICKNDTDGDALRHSQTFGMVSTVSFAVGGAALLTGAVLWLMEPKAQEKKVGKVRVDVLGLDSQGAVMGVRGVW